MAQFSVNVVQVRSIEAIPSADMIELAVIGDYRSVVRKGTVSTGDLVVYIPEASILPDWLIVKMGLIDMLAGSNKNRVKAVKIRKCLSQGLVLPLQQIYGIFHVIGHVIELEPNGVNVAVSFGDNVAEVLGIVKYEPVIPACMAGDVFNAGTSLTVAYDVENYKNFPDLIHDGDQVQITEKIHGTCCGISLLPVMYWTDNDLIIDGDHFIVYSKGLGADGICFKGTEQNIIRNLYIRTLISKSIPSLLVKLSLTSTIDSTKPITMMGEVYGDVQDLKYGGGSSFRAFDLGSGVRGEFDWVARPEAFALMNSIGIPTVPVLYQGPFTKEILIQYTNGTETVSGKSLHMREGVVALSLEPVVRPDSVEFNNGKRVMLKSVSAAYLLRKGDTSEFS